MDLAGALVLASIIMPVLAWHYRSLMALATSWLFNWLALTSSIVNYADAVDTGLRTQYLWESIMYAEYLLVVTNIILTIAIAWMKIIESRERRLLEPP